MVLCIGDVHGWLDRLETVLAADEGPYVFVGDLVDRGADSAGVVARVRRLVAAGRAHCVLGNHEYAMVRALGCPERGIHPVPRLLETWLYGYGGLTTLASYGLDCELPLAELRAGIGDDLCWLADLPALQRLSVVAEGGRWQLLVVHAGLQASAWEPQVRALEDPARPWWYDSFGHPLWLYDKGLVPVVPPDLPVDHLVVSGHTPQPAAYIAAGRLVCDTSGGQPGRRLSAVHWPSARVFTSG